MTLNQQFLCQSPIPNTHDCFFPIVLLGRKCGLNYFRGMKDEICYLVDHQQQLC
jgi:hypothetical protein